MILEGILFEVEFILSQNLNQMVGLDDAWK